jgi:filamentous hemagglutinin family protein
LSGPNYRIGAELGQIRGGNLFHSFGAFNVPTGSSATFTGPSAIANIVGRVTGGQPSLVDGLLRSEIAGANLFLLNPSGMLFGPNARLDVSGSFHVSTADFLRFADGATFSAHLGQESVLTVASPTAFGILGNSPAAITIQGSSLRVAEGKALSVVGGDIEIVGNGSLTANTMPTLGAPSGRVQLATVASPGEAMFSPLDLAPDLQVDGFARLGRITLSQAAFLDASGNGGGAVLLRAGRLGVDRSYIFADNTGPVDGIGLGLDLRITTDAIMANGSFLTTDGLGAGRARDLRLIAGSVRMDNAVVGSRAGAGGNSTVSVGTLALTSGAQLSSGTFGTGRGGDLTVAATEAISITGQGSGLFSETESSGSGGRLFVSAPTLTMEEGRIRTGSIRGGSGNAGDLDVRVGRLTLIGGAQLSSSALGSGRGGAVTVAATEAITISGRDSQGFPSGLFSTAFGSGDAGRLFVSAPSLSMNNGAQISASTFGPGRGGI